MKIAVYAIAKNEEKFVERFMDSTLDADVVVVADTGSTDDTAAKLSGYVWSRVHQITVSPFRFDDARNASLALVPADVDVCVCLDLDEVLQPGWRQEIERLWVPGKTTYMTYVFDWSQGIRFYSDKIHGRHGYRWRNACHEVVVADRIEESRAESQMVMIKHFPDTTKSRAQYRDLLKVAMEENPADPRTAFYYARELGFSQDWQACADASRHYLGMAGGIPSERAWAMRNMSRSYINLGDPERAFHWARRSAAESPHQREGWCELALLSSRVGKWEECLGAALCALAIGDKPGLDHSVDMRCWGPMPYDLASTAAWMLGMKEQAQRYNSLALQLDPENERLLAAQAVMAKA